MEVAELKKRKREQRRGEELEVRLLHVLSLTARVRVPLGNVRHPFHPRRQLEPVALPNVVRPDQEPFDVHRPPLQPQPLTPLDTVQL